MTDFDTSSGLGGGAVLRLTVNQTSQNTGANQSTDSYSLTLIKGAYNSFDLTNTITWAANIDGTASSGTFSFDFRAGASTSQLITSGSKTVTHNGDGTKTISVSGSIGSTGTSTGGPATASGSFAQTIIPPVAVPTGALVSRLSHTLNQPLEYLALATTEAAAFAAIQATAAEITLAALPSDLSSAAVSLPVNGISALDAFNQIVRTEQGYIYTATSGTLLAPVQTVNVRARTRPATVSYTFDSSTEISDVPAFIRDITNVASTVTAAGPSLSATYTDPTLTSRAGSANISESVLNTASVDLLAYAQDRSIRGKNTNLRVVSISIDALTTPTNRLADLLAMVPGDRIQVAGLPSTTLGFTTWDGWLIGGRETHRVGNSPTHKFEMFLAPVLPATAIFDTNYFMADGALTLSASLTNVATTMSVTTSVATTLLETVTFPYTLIIDTEQVTVTACTTAAPQVATITRAVNGTAAAAHSSGAAVEAAVPSLYAF
jgi:hypothetical protein